MDYLQPKVSLLLINNMDSWSLKRWQTDIIKILTYEVVLKKIPDYGLFGHQYLPLFNLDYKLQLQALSGLRNKRCNFNYGALGHIVNGNLCCFVHNCFKQIFIYTHIPIVNNCVVSGGFFCVAD